MAPYRSIRDAVARTSETALRVIDRWIDARGDTVFGASRIGWNIVGLLGGLLGLAVGVAWALTSYWNVDVPAAMSFWEAMVGALFRQTELACTAGGDYSAIQINSLTEQPPGPESVYPVSSRLIRIPFLILQSLFGFQAALITFVLVSIGCVLLPVVWAIRRTPWNFKPIVLTILGLATTPFLVVIDRGNLIALVVPLMFAILYGLIRNRPWMIAIAVIAASSVKPQLALLGFVLIAVRAWRPAVVSILGSVTLVVLSFFLVGNDLLKNIGHWVQTAAIWSVSQPLKVNWPGNISLPRALYVLAHSGPWVSWSIFANSLDSTYTDVTLAVVAIVVVVLVVRGKRLPPLALGISFTVIACLSSPLTFSYYAVFMIPIAAVIFRDGLVGWPLTWVSRIAILLMSVALVLGLTPILVPWGPITAVPVASMLPVLSTCAWGLFLLAIFTWAFLAPRKAPLKEQENLSKIDL